MNPKLDSIERCYDEMYLAPNVFRQRRWIYQPFIRALAKKAGLAKGNTILDLGCGQGFFTSLFAGLGLKALGVDISGEAIRSARERYGSGGAEFEIGDVMNLPYKNAFDCVFVRSCSLYNSLEFEGNRSVTDAFLAYVKEEGVLIFDFNTKLSPRNKKQTWKFHSIAAVKKHFSCYAQARVYFTLRLEATMLGHLALSFPITRIAAFTSNMTGVGGDLLAIVRKN